MAIKVYSDKTKKFYDTIAEANRAEFELKEQENLAKIQKEREMALAKEKKEKELAERKAAAEKVEVARKAYVEAQKAYRTELEGFCNITTGKVYESVIKKIIALFDWFENIFKF